MSVAAGVLLHKVRFERQLTTYDDGAGNVHQPWSTLFTRQAGFRPEFGGEKLAAGRPASSTAGVITIRRDSSTITLTAADRLVFVNAPYAGLEMQIRSVLPIADGQTIELTVEQGVAT